MPIVRHPLSLAAVFAACAPRPETPAPAPATALPGPLVANLVVEGVARPAPGSVTPAYALAVSAVARAPVEVSPLAGRTVVVLLAGEDPLPASGTRLTVLGSVAAVDSLVTVREVRRIPGGLTPSLRERLREGELRQQDSVLAARLALATRVVAARVARVVDTAVGPVRDSEHDPAWRLAVLTVRETLKGEPGAESRLWFPMSRDVMWFDAPRFETGQEGVWLLQPLADPPGFTALHRSDFQPATRLEQIRRLLAAPAN